MNTPTNAPLIGLFSINFHACASPGVGARIAALAERLGYESVWTGEHIVLPSPRVAPSPMEPEEPILDPLIALAHVAGATQDIRLGTGIIILPQRNPVVLAKELASVDIVSNGRLTFGFGVGYLEPELRAIGVPVKERAGMSDEYLPAMQSLWYGDEPQYSGRYVNFSGIDANPRPVQRPIPIVVGGNSPPAHRRAVAVGDGWYGFWMTPEVAGVQIESLRREAERAGRERKLEVSISPAGRLTPEKVEAYAVLGVDRLIAVPPPNLSVEDLERFVHANAPGAVGGRVAPWA